MKHLDPDTLAMAALDEPIDDADSRHLSQCAQCSADVDALLKVVATARPGAGSVQLENPEPAVWTRIHEELGLSAQMTADPLDDTGAAGAASGGTVSAGAAPEDAAAPGTAPASMEAHRRAGRPRSIRAVWLPAAAAVGFLLGAGVVWAISGLDDGPDRQVLAQTSLEPLPGYDADGEVTVTAEEEGPRTLTVTASDTQGDGYREVWLISENLEQMYSLGVLTGDEGSFAIPEQVDLSQFPIVDISDEPADGDPLHSGVSVLRGSISASS